MQRLTGKTLEKVVLPNLLCFLSGAYGCLQVCGLNQLQYPVSSFNMLYDLSVALF